MSRLDKALASIYGDQPAAHWIDLPAPMEPAATARPCPAQAPPAPAIGADAVVRLYLLNIRHFYQRRATATDERAARAATMRRRDGRLHAAAWLDACKQTQFKGWELTK